MEPTRHNPAAWFVTMIAFIVHLLCVIARHLPNPFADERKLEERVKFSLLVTARNT
jgi:hypothetical protein